MSRKLSIFLEDDFRLSTSGEYIPVLNPANQELLSEVPKTSEEEILRAVEYAHTAFLEWRHTPVPERARLMLRYQALLKQHQDDIARILSLESGKTFADAKGDVWRGIEVVEHAANIASLLMGETLDQVATGVDTASYQESLGVCVGITPFNFPAMIPLWMYPLAVACGNTFILKPSEQDPMTSNRLIEIFYEAGAPKGIVQLLHGGKEQVDCLLRHPKVKAVSFVGSVKVGQYIYRTATDQLKRVQCMTGAKNHLVVMPDANKQQVIDNLIGSSCGAAGQRCMAISVAILVGEAQQWLDDLKAAMAATKPGIWDDESADFGPLITPQARQRALDLIASGKAQGAHCLLDGSNGQVQGYPDGNWLGPTLFSDVTADMSIYQQEIFAPVLLTMTAATLDDALAIVNKNPYGNGTSIFTRSGPAANQFRHQVEVGQVGINVPIPVPLPFFSFTGWKNSFYGDQHPYGKQAVRFYTETKTVISRWFSQDTGSKKPNMTINLK